MVVCRNSNSLIDQGEIKIEDPVCEKSGKGGALVTCSIDV